MDVPKNHSGGDPRLASPATLPFFFEGTGPTGASPIGASPGCLLVHGFSGTPEEMRYLGEQLHTRGYSVNGVRLAGHCTSIGDFERATWRDWYASARAGAEHLQQRVPQFVAVGQSMGALLALKLAVDYPQAIAGVALLSPALVLSNPWVRRISPALPLLLPLVGRRRIGRGERDVADQQARATSPSYRQVPLRALHQLVVLQKHVRRLLARVRQPALVVHSRQDHTCPTRNVEILERGLGGSVRSILLEQSFHVISIDVDKERVATEIAAFVEEVAGSATPQHASRSCG